ncbi:HD-GYP domain-containing protein [Gemmatimonas groenlandica]|uniref:Response regulator n=1 Tax=Gemmatimonas groenlandica TaxID=2732249 RepID=A0A6M4IPH4_9BACT|nr:HD domain-containing phosphohydrolase [Gemmatimonas groenlandica]QJR36630.1 response regulator [Gemmatimonas groenlandica]
MTSLPGHDPIEAIEAAGAALAQDSMRRILVVDDESTIRLALSRFLRTRGFEVEVADSGAAALEVLGQHRFSLMLCDLRMPGISGLDVVPRALALDADLGIIMLTAVNDAASATEALSSGAFDYLTKPVELPDLQAAVERAMMRRVRSVERRAVDRLIREEVALRTVQLEHEKGALRVMTVSVAETLINAMEAKDLYLRGHSQRVAEIGAAIARHLELESGTVDCIHTAGRLHDVGKIGIREAVLNKPGPLTHEEFAHVKDHVRIGLDILSPLHHLGDALHFIRDHHEHWDGSGYPFGRTAEDITIGGRILTAADAFDALTSQRAYREPMTADTTLDYLRTQAGRLLEPRIYDALNAVVRGGTVEGIPRVK